jgi:hypothetical protein
MLGELRETGEPAAAVDFALLLAPMARSLVGMLRASEGSCSLVGMVNGAGIWEARND